LKENFIGNINKDVDISKVGERDMLFYAEPKVGLPNQGPCRDQVSMGVAT
jgi:hypothetical protein